MKLFICLLPLLMAVTNCATPAASGPTAVASADAPAQAQECEWREVATGSRLKKKICVTKEQKEREARQAQEDLRRMQPQPVVKGN